MNNFDDIEILWKSSKTLYIPDAHTIIKKADKEKKQVAGLISLQAICMLLAIVAIIVVLYFVQFKYRVTYIGLAIMIICVIAFAFARFRQSLFLRRADFSQSPVKLLQQFEKFHTRQKWINTKGAMWYSIFLNIAFALYFYETVLLATFTVTWKIGLILVYIAWMLIAIWLGKGRVKKEHEKTKAIIEKLWQLKNGLQ